MSSMPDHPPDHPAAHEIRALLRGRTGRSFWRSLEEIAGTPSFRTWLEAEFPSLAPAADRVDRRAILKVMAASLALAGLTGCDGEADEAALPYVEAPEFVTPGRPKWYATATTLAGYAQPAVGKTEVGRPVKLEGNPEHPASLGTTDPFLQASLLDLYDPDRSQAPRHLGRNATWDAFDLAMAGQVPATDLRQGEGLRLLTGTVTSPTLSRQIDAMLARWPRARWHVSEPVSGDLRLEAARIVFGRSLDQHPRLDVAEIVVSFDDDLLGPGPRQVLNAQHWSMRRQARQRRNGECRLFVAEPTPSITGAMAEDRLPASPSRIAVLVRALAARLGITAAPAAEPGEREERWLRAVTEALHGRPGRSLVSVGAHHPAELQALALLVTDRLGGIGSTLTFTEPIAKAPPDGSRSLPALVTDMAAGRVTSLVMLGCNPVYDAAHGLNFARHLEQVPFRLHAGTHYDETAEHSHWHVPLHHELEAWSDARAVDGTVSIVQPLIRPLYATRSAHTILDNLGTGQRSDRQIVSETWRQAWSEAFEGRWRSALYQGFVAGTALPPVTPAVTGGPLAQPPGQDPGDGLVLALRPDPCVWDGRFANNAWLQELPRPLTKITWGNVILISPKLAAERGLANADEVAVEADGRRVTGPVWIMPGQDERTITATFGYGRRRVGQVGQDLGYDAYVLRDDPHQWHRQDVVLTATGERQDVATTQLHQAMDGFDFVRIVDPADLPDEPAEGTGATIDAEVAGKPTLFPQDHWDSPSWGMSIDVDLCIGCNACVVACVAENNVPMVGRELVAMGREMHWLRVDHYHEGDPNEPKSYFQPVPCMHCEKAPCEMGCPVNAAVHSFDGLNLQVYNRCIGTRTCSSFCPYKVRRFNWFDYTGDDPEPVRAMRNPDVTVRSRGVMEKCTYCVQRISAARIAAKIEDREIEDGEVVTACQQACPTRAIVFGNVLDRQAEVSRRKAGPRDYSLLEEANTRPRTTYLARIEKTDGGA
ncbi:MAG TPA: TAT-variant-translocated molybdopterin oxidoreductase [Geminicoccus sp.]|uniref:TAT-variant-translocated molybdopterin oxidoreductase n=1 Tax=Geminicoccus sp. TaxID=2024832 RepID=UPI002B6A40EE|nr:TAT-variant-translocated molybdopterin oxidoreductase [Geminicoccus sp.]HWL69543.1 TAT-variant-translocated molybdopterin oxidoreductase [Geminicoccus sp.]